MLKQLRRRLTYANVASTIALFGILAGGSAWAATALIGPDDIASNAIYSRHIKNGQVRAADLRQETPVGVLVGRVRSVAAGTHYGAPSGESYSRSTWQQAAMVRPPAMTSADVAYARNLYVSLSTPPGSGHTVEVRLMQHGFETPLTCTVPSGLTGCQDNDHIASIGNMSFSIKVVSSPGTPVEDVMFGYIVK